jgi:hypothetical protein
MVTSISRIVLSSCEAVASVCLWLCLWLCADCVTGRLFQLCNKNVYMRGDSGANGDDDNTVAGVATFWKIIARYCGPGRVSLRGDIIP